MLPCMNESVDLRSWAGCLWSWLSVFIVGVPLLVYLRFIMPRSDILLFSTRAVLYALVAVGVLWVLWRVPRAMWRDRKSIQWGWVAVIVVVAILNIWFLLNSNGDTTSLTPVDQPVADSPTFDIDDFNSAIDIDPRY